MVTPFSCLNAGMAHQEVTGALTLAGPTMTPLAALKARLLEIASTATTAAEALDAGRVDYLPPELSRLLGSLDVLAGRLVELCERLAVGVDPQGEGRRG